MSSFSSSPFLSRTVKFSRVSVLVDLSGEQVTGTLFRHSLPCMLAMLAHSLRVKQEQQKLWQSAELMLRGQILGLKTSRFQVLFLHIYAVLQISYFDSVHHLLICSFHWSKRGVKDMNLINKLNICYGRRSEYFVKYMLICLHFFPQKGNKSAFNFEFTDVCKISAQQQLTTIEQYSSNLTPWSAKTVTDVQIFKAKVSKVRLKKPGEPLWLLKILRVNFLMLLK